MAEKSIKTRAKKSPARSGRAGKAREKLADLPDLISHTPVADKFGTTTRNIRDWVAAGEFPEPHSIGRQAWFYRVDFVRAFLETGRSSSGAGSDRPGLITPVDSTTSSPPMPGSGSAIGTVMPPIQVFFENSR